MASSFLSIILCRAVLKGYLEVEWEFRTPSAYVEKYFGIFLIHWRRTNLTKVWQFPKPQASQTEYDHLAILVYLWLMQHLTSPYGKTCEPCHHPTSLTSGCLQYWAQCCTLCLRLLCDVNMSYFKKIKYVYFLKAIWEPQHRMAYQYKKINKILQFLHFLNHLYNVQYFWLLVMFKYIFS